ncbi:MAG: hypothetical protein KDH17_09940 [Rhodocyclaceae bacterium]|nr:hypothetical protein [Rhodocyclaceae bacterium]
MDHRMSRGVWSGARSSSATSHASLPLAWQVLLLLAAGVTVALLHEGFRFPLKMPGHHGIEWFGILLLARLASPLKLAGITVAAGAILGTATFGAHGLHAVQGIVTLLQAGVVDLAFAFLAWVGRSAAALMVLGALTHMLAPLVKAAAQSAGGAQFGSLASGLAYPLSTHLLFGASGALAAWLCFGVLARARGHSRR